MRYSDTQQNSDELDFKLSKANKKYEQSVKLLEAANKELEHSRKKTRGSLQS